MKKELFISLIIVFIAILCIFVTAKKPISSSTTAGASSAKTQTTTSVTLAQVMSHDTEVDCWIIINNKAYSVSAYLSSHPGGNEAIIPYCGKDATSAYNSIKGGRGHSTSADGELSSLLVGVVQ